MVTKEPPGASDDPPGTTTPADIINVLPRPPVTPATVKYSVKTDKPPWVDISSTDKATVVAESHECDYVCLVIPNDPTATPGPRPVTAGAVYPTGG